MFDLISLLNTFEDLSLDIRDWKLFMCGQFANYLNLRVHKIDVKESPQDSHHVNWQSLGGYKRSN